MTPPHHKRGKNGRDPNSATAKYYAYTAKRESNRFVPWTAKQRNAAIEFAKWSLLSAGNIDRISIKESVDFLVSETGRRREVCESYLCTLRRKLRKDENV